MDHNELLREALECLRHYRSRAHWPANEPGWQEVRSWVSDDAMNTTDAVLIAAKAEGLLAPTGRW